MTDTTTRINEILDSIETPPGKRSKLSEARGSARTIATRARAALEVVDTITDIAPEIIIGDLAVGLNDLADLDDPNARWASVEEQRDYGQQAVADGIEDIREQLVKLDSATPEPAPAAEPAAKYVQRTAPRLEMAHGGAEVWLREAERVLVAFADDPMWNIEADVIAAEREALGREAIYVFDDDPDPIDWDAEDALNADIAQAVEVGEANAQADALQELYGLFTPERRVELLAAATAALQGTTGTALPSTLINHAEACWYWYQEQDKSWGEAFVSTWSALRSADYALAGQVKMVVAAAYNLCPHCRVFSKMAGSDRCSACVHPVPSESEVRSR